MDFLKRTFGRHGSSERTSRGPTRVSAEESRRYGTSMSNYSTLWITDIDELEIMADHLFQSIRLMDWTKDSSLQDFILLRSGSSDECVMRPDVYLEKSSMETVAMRVNAQAILRMSSELATKVIEQIPPMSSRIALRDGREIEVVESCETIKERNKRGGTTFCLERSTHTAIVWSDNPKYLLKEAKKCERDLVSLLWSPKSQTNAPSAYVVDTQEKTSNVLVEVREILDNDPHSLETQSQLQKPARLVWPTIVSLTFVLMGAIFGRLLSSVATAVQRDGTYEQAAFVLYLPLVGFLSSFFLSIIVVGLFQLFGPISQLHSNSRSYSGTKPAGILRELPHITIQCPVYREGLMDVIDPTVETLREAIATYESQGGTAGIIMNDDGMQIMSEDDRQIRQHYYARNNIGWIARPGHNQAGFLRAGAFKKASNMNFGMRVSLAVEAEYEKLWRQEGHGQDHETYQIALQRVKGASNGQVWAEGDIGLGDFILLVDADTRVPSDCLVDAAKEFHGSPDLAILQHPSGVLQVAHNFWEDSLSHFTRNNYFGTRYVVSSGDATPFFGHNAFLRWSAIDDVGDVGDDGLKRWWSENHVSEDFEIALKLQSAGYTTRMAGYSENRFEEGVCLSVYDEISRWEKYAFGVSELIFMPVHQWVRGPFTPLFKQFINSPTDLAAKCSSIFYMGTYFGIGLTWLLCLINYFLVGWLPLLIRSYYTDSLQVLIAVSVIFGLKDALVGPFVRYRLNEVTLWRGFVDSIKYFVITSLFFQGLSMHVSKCLVMHLCGLKMSWGATNKSVQDSKLKDDLAVLWQRYKYIYILIGALATMMIVLGFVVSDSWRITSPKAVLPLAWMLFWHFSIPLLMHNRSFLSEIYKQRIGK